MGCGIIIFSLPYQLPSETACHDGMEMEYMRPRAIYQLRLEITHPNFTQIKFYPCGFLPYPRTGYMCESTASPPLNAIFQAAGFNVYFYVLRTLLTSPLRSPGPADWPLLPCSGMCCVLLADGTLYPWAQWS